MFERPSLSVVGLARADPLVVVPTPATGSLCQSSPLKGVCARSDSGAGVVFSARSTPSRCTAPHICQAPTLTSATTERPAATAIPEKLPRCQDSLLTP